jgi:uncharacterized protein YkwD
VARVRTSAAAAAAAFLVLLGAAIVYVGGDTVPALRTIGVSKTRAATAAPTSPQQTAERRLAQELFHWANRERAARGLHPLLWDEHAAAVAQDWAGQLRSRQTLAHRPHDQLAAAFAPPGYRAAGENVGMGRVPSGWLDLSWMQSDSHRRNILQVGFDRLGVGVACDGQGRIWAVQDFGASAGAPAPVSGGTPPAAPIVSNMGAGGSCPGTPGGGGRGPVVELARAPDGQGYWFAAADGVLLPFGSAPFRGTATPGPGAAVVGLAPTRSGQGYWLAVSSGGIYSFGDAGFKGSAGSLPLKAPIVGMAATPSGEGYWLLAADGGVFSFGDARFHGSTGNLRLNAPVVAMAPTPSGDGYWLLAADGGVFSFGGARFHGSTGNIRLNSPVVDFAATPSGRGYWLVASDGGVFAFGDARFHGSTGNLRLNAPVVDLAPTAKGDGYWMAAADGGIFAFDAPYLGSGAG